MSNLQDKYAKLIAFAQTSDIADLSVTEQDNIMYINGSATATIKDSLWKLYNEIDPDMRAGDLVLNIEVVEGKDNIYEIKAGDSLSKIATKYPGVSWQQIFEANKDIIKDPNMIYPGMKIKIPN